MQTFLPYADFRASAQALDDRRLGKQRVEALQILRALTREKCGWQNHPATRMWRGYQEALAAYGMEMCDEWIRRGHPDTVKAQLMPFAGDRQPTQQELAQAGKLPPWLGDEALHRSHCAARGRCLKGHLIHYCQG